MPTPPPRQFDFGQNWLEFSQQALSSEKIAAAVREFKRLHENVPLAGRTFLDIGFGQGLSLLSAHQAGARVVGCDINPKCAEALAVTQAQFSTAAAITPPLVVGSVLDRAVIERLRAASPAGDGWYDIVHSWGVLHHTGDMRTAVAHAASLVRPGGHFVLALYNRHWSSRPWLWVKWLYVHSPRWLQKTLIAVCSPIIYLAKWLVTGRSPRHQQRGMDFYYNVIDWVGGYPYEYESVNETVSRMADLGFVPLKTVTAEVPTGCNEFVFLRRA
ncbi:MAG TPA: methyltransferase domain-containing protein [Opitutaceae bacterium]|nr:methyltransferase domain-containing protein [Opitutaceae bacterium]